MNADFLGPSAKYFSITSDSNVYSNLTFKATIIATDSTTNNPSKTHQGDIVWSVAGAGNITSAAGDGWKNGKQVFTLGYTNPGLAPGQSITIALKAVDAANRQIQGTGNNFIMNGPLDISELVFEEKFDTGLSNWNQVSGAWTAGTPSVSGLALRSPTGGTNATYVITTTSNIDLTARSNCILDYEISYSVGAYDLNDTQIAFAGNLLGQIDEVDYASTFSSAGAFLPRRNRIPDGLTGKITFTVMYTSVTFPNIIAVDNVKITCANNIPAPVTVFSENFESGLANWSPDPQWVNTAVWGWLVRSHRGQIWLLGLMAVPYSLGRTALALPVAQVVKCGII